MMRMNIYTSRQSYVLCSSKDLNLLVFFHIASVLQKRIITTYWIAKIMAIIISPQGHAHTENRWPITIDKCHHSV